MVVSILYLKKVKFNEVKERVYGFWSSALSILLTPEVCLLPMVRAGSPAGDLFRGWDEPDAPRGRGDEN